MSSSSTRKPNKNEFVQTKGEVGLILAERNDSALIAIGDEKSPKQV